jgi:PAS domain S-box-containing protein
MNSGGSTADSGFGDVPNQPSPIESSQSRVSATNPNLGSFQALLEAAIDAINHVDASIATFRMFADREWEYDYISAGNTAVFGYTAEEFIADKLLWLERVHPEDRESLLACFESTLTAGTLAIEYRYYHKDGSLRWISDTFTCRRVESADCWMITVLGINITDRKQAEIALKKSKERYILAVQAGQVGVWDWNLQTNDTHIDPQLKAMLGYEAEELSNNIEAWRGLIHPEDLERITEAMTRYLAGELPEYALEHRMLHKDGSIRWFLTRGVAFWDAEGQPNRMVGTRTDITERKRTEEALRISEAKFASAFRSSPDGISLTTLDEGVFIEVNDRFCTMTGYRLEEIIGRTSIELKIQISVETRNELIQALQQTGVIRDYENDFRTKSGEIRTGLMSAEVIDFGGQQCLLSVIKDITDRKQAEESTKQQAVWEQLIRTITQRIHQSLDLEQVLTTAVTEVRQVLQADRALIFRLHPDGSGQVIKEAAVPEYPVTEKMRWLNECFPPECDAYYCQGKPRIVPSVLTDDWSSCLAEFMQEVQVQSKVIAPITHHPENASVNLWGLLIVHACSYQRQWQVAEAEFLQQVSNQLAIAIQQANFYQQSQTELVERKQTELAMQQAMEREQQIRERERFIATIAQNIRQSLDLNEILNTTVGEVRRFLDVERVVIYCFNPDWSGHIVAESLVHESYSIMQALVEDRCFRDSRHQPYQQERIHAINDILTANLQPCYVDFLTQLRVRAVLVVPILVQQDLWGLLIAHQCTGPREWQQISWYLLRQLSTQLAIGIYQSELYQQVRQLNTNLESQVRDRTAELQRSLEFEALLKRITDKVRDSLDEAQILQTVVQELALGLVVKGCDVALNDVSRQITVIRYEYISEEIPSAQGREVPMDNLDDVINQLRQGKTSQFCRIVSDPIRPFERQFTILGCPIIDSQTVLGDLWLFRNCEATFSDPEIRLVQQVTNQCAIAIRQARLYETAQTQVTELERLNQLKDDFLSTVSHELRTPVSSIKMAVQMLEIMLSRSEEANQEEPDAASLTLDSPTLRRFRQYCQILQDESQREIDLINNLLDLTRLDAEAESLQTNTINLQGWLPHVVKPFLEQINRHNQQLQITIPADLPLLTTDLSYVQRILSELLTNACKYTPAGGAIEVSARLVDEAGGNGENLESLIQNPKFKIQSFSDSNPLTLLPSLLISITNTGVEIPPQELSRIFDKFYRIPNNDPWRHGGTGLGLALVQKLANRLGAVIYVESAGGQTTFTLQFALN